MLRWLTLAYLAPHLMMWAMDREPDQKIGGDAGTYLRRWYLIPRNRWFNIFVHQFLRSDHDRALHDHPWANCSLLLHGSYFEHSILNGGVHQFRRMNEGDFKFRGARCAHRVELINREPTWSLFFTGPQVRDWGFHCPKGWRHHDNFNSFDQQGCE